MGNQAARFVVSMALGVLLACTPASAAYAAEGDAAPATSAPAPAAPDAPAPATSAPAPAPATPDAPASAFSGGEGCVVRVAFPEAQGFSMTDEDGVRTGVLYDWLTELSKYTGWRYEFVEGDIDDLLDEALRGEIDLMGGTYQRDELASAFDYSRFSMGANRTLLMCPRNDDALAAFDLRTLDGTTIGAFENADDKIRRLENFLDFHELDCTVLRLDYDAFQTCLEDGTADIKLASDVEMKGNYKVVAEFESEPYYFTLPSGSDLLPALDEAMTQVYAADPGFARELYGRYYPEEYASPIAFSAADRAYVQAAGEVRVAVIADRYPVYYERDGKHQGVAKEVFELLAERTGLAFRFVHAATYEEALDLVRTGEADVLGCFMDDAHAAAEQGLALTNRYASLDEVVFRSKLSSAKEGQDCVVAQVEGRLGGDVARGAQVEALPTFQACLEAVNAGRADLTSMPASFAESLFTNRSYGNVAPATAEHRETELSIALPEPIDAGLYSVLSKAVNSFSGEELDAVMSRNTAPLDRPATLESLVSQNPLLAVALVLVFFLMVGAIAVVVVGSKVRSRMMQLKLEKAEETGRAKADFLSRMSHEIRTPMNAIIGLSSVASLSSEATPAIRTSLEKINTSAQFLLALVNDILDMSKIENDKMRIEIAPMRLEPLVERLQSMFGVQAEEKGIALETRCAAAGAVVADDVRLQQVLANLLSNAFKFTDAGGTVRLDVEDASPADAKRALVRFRVCDDGAGIHPEDLERIFASFEQAAENHRNAQGTGLGLAISSNLVRLMGGRLEVASTLGEGSAFSFTLALPRAADESTAHDAEEGPAASPADAEAASLAGTRVLLAEDNDLNAEIAQALLEMEGVAVERACNGREAVDLFAAAPPGRYDFVLMDVQMPVLDGLGAAAEIRALPRADAGSVPLVALTANTFQEDRDSAAAAGMNGFIPKPFDAQQLYGTLRSFLSPRDEGRRSMP